jgi:tetratricopeptide (TPR) repeat protein
MALTIAGCAGVQPKPTPQWQCDSQADAAVQNGDWEAARAGHEALLRRDPANGLAHYHLGYIMGKVGGRSDEIENYRAAIAAGYDHDDQLYFNLGMAYFDLGRNDAAIEAMQRAIAVNTKSADNHFGLAMILDGLDRTTEAEAALEEALRLEPDHVEAVLLLAGIRLDQSRWDEARTLLEGLLKRDPENEDALQLMEVLRFRQGVLYDDQ